MRASRTLRHDNACSKESSIELVSLFGFFRISRHSEERMNQDVFKTKTLKKGDSVTSRVLKSIDHDAKLFTICRAQLVKEVSCD